MPSTYAHYVFGQYVYCNLKRSVTQKLVKNMDLFNIGLHGPDILFYYHPLHRNHINSVGFDLHDKNADTFFESGMNIIQEGKYYQQSLAYILGFICHFVLDSEWHTYIEQVIRDTGISHTEIEVEFDRMLMYEDGYEPLTHNLTNHIIPSERNAKVIAQFFPTVNAEQVEEALESMIGYNQLLLAPGKVKRSLIYGLLRVSGNYKEMHGLIVNRIPNIKCLTSNQELRTRLMSAIPIAVRLIEEYFDDCVNLEELPLGDSIAYTADSRFHRTFGPDKDQLKVGDEYIYEI